jgi:predicted PurR-regulated permease PerM
MWGPAVIILVIGGHWWKALILLGWGAGVVGQIDTLVRPYVISGRVKLHTLLVFFALLGGVEHSASWGSSSARSSSRLRS